MSIINSGKDRGKVVPICDISAKELSIACGQGQYESCLGSIAHGGVLSALFQACLERFSSCRVQVPERDDASMPKEEFNNGLADSTGTACGVLDNDRAEDDSIPMGLSCYQGHLSLKTPQLALFN